VSNKNVSPEKVMKVCNILAKRYKDSQEYEDLYQEGFLAAWEALENGADMPNAIGIMRRAMNDYKNITLKPVSIPKSGAVYSLLGAINSGSGVSPQGNTEVALYEALTGSLDTIQPSTKGVVEGSEETYITKELHQYVVDCLWVYLEPQEAAVIHLMYVEDYTQYEVAQELDLPQGTVSKVSRKGMKKLKKALEQVT